MPRPTVEQQADALEEELTDDERAVLDDFADAIHRVGMATPALFFFESMKPLGFVGSQALIFFRPLVQALWRDPATYDRVTRLLERRGAIELLLRRLER